ncbi:MAG TPA: glycosyltransferase [Chthoniobacterales bacterium]
MQIAFIVAGFPIASETFILNQITGLLQRGHQVDVFAQWRDTGSGPHPDVTRFRLVERTFYLHVSPHRTARLLSALDALGRAMSRGQLRIFRALDPRRFGRQALNLRVLNQMRPFIGRPAYAVVHCHFGPSGVIGDTVRQLGLTAAPLLTTFHGYDISSFVRERGPEVYKNLFRDGDAFTCSSQFIRNRLVSAGCPAPRIHLFKLGTDLKKFSFTARVPDETGAVRLVTVARLTEKKGLEYSIRAFAKLAARFPLLEYNIVGDGDQRKPLERLLNGLGLNGRVRLLGWRTDPEVREIYARSHLFVLSSVEAANGDIEGQGMVLQEAQAMGLPVVCSRHNGFPEGILENESGFLVPERDADALAACLTTLLQRPGTWPEMGQRGRAYVEAEYDLEKRNDALVALYDELRARRARP